MSFASLIDELTCALNQELNLLKIISAEDYAMSGAGYFSSSLGQHVRHNLDHIASFFYGLPHGRIDYESRERRAELEEDPDEAERCLKDYLTKLEGLKGEADHPLEVRQEDGQTLANAVWQQSSIAREIQFLLSHTVHHNALIAQIAERMGLQLPTGFGIAPSTLRHQAAQANA